MKEYFIMKNFKAFWKNRKVFIGVTMICIVIYAIGNIFHNTEADSYFSNLGKIQILKDTMPNFVINRSDYIEHNKIILSVLQGREMTFSSELSAKNGIIWQMRFIYFAVLAGLFTLLLSKKSKTNIGPYFIIIILIMITYLFDIHLDDQYKRKYAEYSVTKGSVDSLVISMTYGNNWYGLNYNNFTIRLAEGFNKRKDRLRRKFLTACEILQNAERFNYYIIPFIGVYFVTILRGDKDGKNDKSKGQASWPPSTRRSSVRLLRRKRTGLREY